MIVGYGDNNLLLLAVTEKEVDDLRKGVAITFEGVQHLTKDIVLMWGRDKAHVLEILQTGGVTISEGMRSDYLAGKRTDNPRKPS